MARVTIEDCVDKVENRFLLVLLMAHRARSVHEGGDLRVVRENDKDTVIALRELAEGEISYEELLSRSVSNLQKQSEADDANNKPSWGNDTSDNDKDTRDIPEEGDNMAIDEEELLRRLLSGSGL